MARVCCATEEDHQRFFTDGWENGDLEPDMALALMTAVISRLSGTFLGGRDGGFWDGDSPDDDDDDPPPTWEELFFLMPTKTLGPLCKQYEAKMKDLKLSTQPSIFKRFTQSGWRGNELLPGVVDFLCHRLAVMLLLGRNYKHPVGEVPGKHDLTFGGRGEESDSENGSGDDDTITGTKRKSKTGRKTRNNFRKVEECSLTRLVSQSLTVVFTLFLLCGICCQSGLILSYRHHEGTVSALSKLVFVLCCFGASLEFDFGQMIVRVCC